MNFEEKIKRKLEQLKNPKGFNRDGTSRGPKRTWKINPKKESAIRLIGYPSKLFKKNKSLKDLELGKLIEGVTPPECDDPFQELFFHWRIGGKNIMCLERNFEEDCPACNLGRKLNSAGEKDIAKKLIPTPRYYGIMIDREDGEPFPRFYGFPNGIYQQLLENLVSEDYKNFLDLTEGLDATVKMVQKQEMKFSQPDLTFRRKESRLAETDEQIEKILRQIVPIHEVMKPMVRKDIEKALEDWMGISDDVGEVRGKVEEEKVEKVEKVEDKKEEASSDLDDAFDKALDDINGK